MREPRATVARFPTRDLPDDPVAFVRAGIDRAARGPDGVVDVDAPAPAVAARIGRWATVEPLDHGRCRVRMAADDLDWPAFALLQLHADFVVQQPDEFADFVASVGRRFGAANAE
jgi:predicted DNA-binding transcriptional regulator YafY